MSFEFLEHDRILHVHIFDQITHEFLRSVDIEIKANSGLPIGSTLLLPPSTSTNQVAVFQGDEWSILPDYRGETRYLKSTGIGSTIDSIGDIDSKYTDLQPIECGMWDESLNKWVIDADKKAKYDSNQFKFNRDAQVLTLTVDINGVIFDANEVSQLRMATRLASCTSDDELIKWKLHDNTHADVSVTDFRAALKKASVETTKIWFGE